MSLTPRGMSVQEAYRLFAEGKLVVNRRYQRKLVWSEGEKRHLIDSVEREYPIPLFMFARFQDDGASYEIIDGMQRLNAIFSFIEHQFVDEGGRCFDIEQFNRAKLSRDAGVFTEFAPEVPRLSPNDCAKLLEYQLAVTIDTEGDDQRINEVFGRINSTGRQLSPQEQRQAGLVSPFSEFVRRLAMQLRGDASPDVLKLNQMPEVSINTPRERQRYGISASDVFWCKHAIISAHDLAKGEDEQIVTDLAISLLNQAPLGASREVFDTYFDPSSEEFKAVNASLAAYGQERLEREIQATISAIRTTFETPNFTSFRNTVQQQPANTARQTFYAVFMAYHRLMFGDSRYPDNLTKIVNSLEGAQKDMIRSAHHTKPDDRERNISVIVGLIQGAFVKKDVTALGTSFGLVIDLENSLRRSKYEASRYEFKLGISELSNSPSLDKGMMPKLARTAVAIANSNPRVDGYIYLGVADKESAADRARKLFEIDPIKIGEVFFVGLSPDLSTLKMSIEDYVKYIISEITALDISAPLKTQLTTTIDHAEYQGRPFVRIRVPGQSDLSTFAGELPVRKNSESVNMTAAEALAQAKLFAPK